MADKDIDEMYPQNGRFIKDDDTIENYAVKDGFHITDTERNALSEGLSFASGIIFENVAQNGNAIVHFKTGSKACVLSFGVGANGSVDYALYRGAVVTANGTEFGGINRNMVTVVANTAKTYSTPTTTSIGTAGVKRMNGGAPGPAKGGNGVEEGKFTVIPPNTSVLLIATNKSTTASRINTVVNWIEKNA